MFLLSRKSSCIAFAAAIFSASLAGVAHATEGCNAMGWDQRHDDVQGCTLYYPAIEWLYDQGIAKGVENPSMSGHQLYQPERSINRAEFTKLVLLASGASNPPPPCIIAPFPDVPKDAWFAPYICAAKNKGIISGFPDGTFKPAIDVNFANGAKILAKTFAIPIDAKDAIIGDGQESVWYRPYTKALLNKKAVAETIGSFTQSINRGEMAEMLYRLKTGHSSINKTQPPIGSELYPDDSGMGYEMHKLEFAFDSLFYLSSEPDPPFIFAPSFFHTNQVFTHAENMKGWAFSHTVQQERWTLSGLWQHVRPTFTDWQIALYVSPAKLSFTQNYRNIGVIQRYVGGKLAECVLSGVEGENTEYCIVPIGQKTLIVVRDYIDPGFMQVEGATPLETSDAMYARIRKSIVFEGQ